MSLPIRKTLRARWHRYDGAEYFVTICTQGRVHYFGEVRDGLMQLAEGWGQFVTPLSLQTAGGRQRVNCASQEGIFRIIQSIPSPKAEPFKVWMAEVAT